MSGSTNTIPQFSKESDVIQHAAALAKTKDWQQLSNVILAHSTLIEHNANAHHLMGVAAFHQQDFVKASQFFNNTLNIKPDYGQATYYLGCCERKLGNLQHAADHLNHAIKLRGSYPEALAELALTLRDMNRLELALQCYEQLQTQQPDYPGLDNAISIVYDSLGEKEKATHHLNRALEQDPNNSAILYNIVRRQPVALNSDIANRLTDLHQSLSEQSHAEDLARTCYALAHIHEQQGQHAQAFSYYQQANDIQARHRPVDVEHEVHWANSIKETFSAEYCAQHANASTCNSTAPIFIVGMPRSGTSLAERILAAHPKVTGAGELDIMRSITLHQIPVLTAADYPLNIADLSDEQFKTLGEHYVSHIQSFGDTPHITDKMPHNFYHIGLIKRILPNAKIIHCTRNAMDTCWSLWRQNFLIRHSYKHQFDNLARIYATYCDIMAHWHTCFGNTLQSLSYEKLLDDPQTEIEALLAFCGLKWHDDCLNFHTKRPSVFTASTHQVNRPLYKDAIASWAPVKNELKPLQDALESYGVIEQ